MLGLGQKIKDIKDKAKGKVVEKMLEKQLGNLPEDQKKMIMSVIEDNPDFFKELSDEIKKEMDSGVSQMAASLKVMRKYQNKLQKMLLDKIGDPRKMNRNLR